MCRASASPSRAGAGTGAADSVFGESSSCSHKAATSFQLEAALICFGSERCFSLSPGSSPSPGWVGAGLPFLSSVTLSDGRIAVRL